jgi:MFS family permease
VAAAHPEARLLRPNLTHEPEPFRMPEPTEDTYTAPRADDECPTSVAEAESDTSSPPDSVVRRGTTFESFRHRGYLLFWSGALVSNVGTWMQTAVIALIAYGFRRSEFDVGLVTFLSQIPSLFLALPGGVLADRVDKRRLIIWAQVLLMFQAIAFAVLYVTGHLAPSTPIASLALVSFLGLIAGVLTALSFPAWQAIIPDLVPRETLMNAIALNSAQFQSARMLGPLAAAGIILVAGAVTGIADVFWINAVSFLFVIAALWAVRVMPHAPEKRATPEREGTWKSLAEGVRYAATHRLVGIVIVSTAIMSLVGMPYVFLLPSVADKVLGFHTTAGYTNVYNFLLAANGLGALIGALVVASLPHSVRRERLMRWSLLATAIVLLAFAFTPTIWLSVPLSAIAGACVLTTNSLANTSVQANVPARLRGRVMSVYITCFLGVMPLSAAAFGPIAQAVGPARAIAGGAVVLLAWAVFLIARPSLLTAEAQESSGADVAPSAD